MGRWEAIVVSVEIVVLCFVYVDTLKVCEAVFVIGRKQKLRYVLECVCVMLKRPAICS